jgi:hypothetical protein
MLLETIQQSRQMLFDLSKSQDTRPSVKIPRLRCKLVIKALKSSLSFQLHPQKTQKIPNKSINIATHPNSFNQSRNNLKKKSSHLMPTASWQISKIEKSKEV